MHLETEVGNMCNNIKNLNAENLNSADQNQQSDNNNESRKWENRTMWFILKFFKIYKRRKYKLSFFS